MKLLFIFLAFALAGPLHAQPQSQRQVENSPEREASRISSLARLYYKNKLNYEPELAYFRGIDPPRHDGLRDNTLRGVGNLRVYESWMLRELRSIDAELLHGRGEWVTYAYMREDLEAAAGLKVCESHLWNVNQMGGWHTVYPRLAELQPVGEDVLRTQAMKRWEKFPAFIDTEIFNAQLGLQRGYSVPRSVVRRVIEQIDGMLQQPLDEMQLTSPARRSDHEAFAAGFSTLVRDEILPAYVRYRDFLENDYLPLAREELSVLAIPKGRECYEASLRAYTTLERSPEAVFELGEETVAANRERVVALGQAAYGLDDFTAIIEHIKADPGDKFDSAEALLEFARGTVDRARDAMPRWFGNVPQREAVVEPFPDYQEGTGMSARYEAGDGDRPGKYRIPLHQPGDQSRGRVEATAFHEVWPGHHLQVAVAQEIPDRHELTGLLWFSGMGEGWARYAEGLAAEADLYTTVSGPILRLAWPARGMVVDPGIHIFGWSREQAREFMGEAGRMSESQLDDMIDRIAILPGQLTAYDSGGLEILALRSQAESELGDHFDVRAFHDAVLANGTLPLTALRAQVERWIEAEKAGIAAGQSTTEANEG